MNVACGLKPIEAAHSLTQHEARFTRCLLGYVLTKVEVVSHRAKGAQVFERNRRTRSQLWRASTALIVIGPYPETASVQETPVRRRDSLPAIPSAFPRTSGPHARPRPSTFPCAWCICALHRARDYVLALLQHSSLLLCLRSLSICHTNTRRSNACQPQASSPGTVYHEWQSGNAELHERGLLQSGGCRTCTVQRFAHRKVSLCGVS